MALINNMAKHKLMKLILMKTAKIINKRALLVIMTTGNYKTISEKMSVG